MVRLIINGAGGTMGRVITNCALEHPETYEVVAGVIKFPEEDYGPAFPLFLRPEDCTVDADVIIDFSAPAALPGSIALAKRLGCGLVVGTTGLAPEHYSMIDQAGETIPVFLAANMSLGVNLQMDLIRRAASFLGDAFDIEIVERHHNRKVDAPSGTALALAKALSEQFPEGKDFVYDRHSVRQRRSKREIGISAVRGGTVVGEHTVMFLGEDEILEVTHNAYSKKIFAAGALRAAQFINGKAPKVYTMSEIFADQTAVTNIDVVRGQTALTLSHLSSALDGTAQIFTLIADQGINIDMISQSAPVAHTIDLSFTLPDEDVERACAALAPLGDLRMSRMSGLSKLSIEGFGMEHNPGVAARVFSALSDAQVDVKLVTTSETKISVCIPEEQIELAREAVAMAF